MKVAEDLIIKGLSGGEMKDDDSSDEQTFENIPKDIGMAWNSIMEVSAAVNRHKATSIASRLVPDIKPIYRDLFIIFVSAQLFQSRF